jgi:putative ABC transport system permease protein
MRRVDPGVEPERVLTFWVVPSEARIPPAQAPAFVERLVTAIERAPGVEFVTVDGGGPLAGSASSTLFIDGRPEPPVGQAPAITRHYVAPNHFRTLGIPLLRGRAFTDADAAGMPGVAIVSESAARRFWPGEDPIGRRIWFGSSIFNSRERSVEIVGVAGDVRYQPFDRPVNLSSVYTPYRQYTFAPRMVFVRGTGSPQALIPDVRRAVATVDPELALQEVRPLPDLLSGSWARRRYDATLFGGFGAVALLLACSGIFAVLAYSVQTRRREFGIRIALGARRERLIAQVLREGLAFPIAGIAAGLAAAVAFTRVLQSSLHETSAQDPAVFGTMTAVLLAASAAACLGPAWRATRADPIESLRAD